MRGKGLNVTGVGVVAAAVAATLVCTAVAHGAEGEPEESERWSDRSVAENWRERKFLTNPDEGRYVPILTASTLNETPHITSEIRPYYLYNSVPSDFLTNGGSINVVGVQGRLAVTDRIGVFISKSGYAWTTWDEILPDADGPTNIAFGAKYLVWASPKKSTLVTGGLRYEVASGDIESGQVDLQGGGDGFLDPFLTFGAQSKRAGVQTSMGFNCAVDGDHDSTAFHYSLHFDYEIFERLFALVETNLLTTISEGNRTPSAVLGSFEGYDLFNFGNDDSGTVMTAGAGARYRINDHLVVGAGFETPLPGRQDLVGFRVLFDVVAHL
jgi:opacity protein-like surface antigen